MDTRYVIVRTSPSGVLVHHGIKGQKWGVQNGPPYPLDESDLSSAERKANTGEVSGNSRSLVRNKSVSEMSDDELRKVTQRLRLENDYINALNASRGKSFLQKAADVSKNANTILVNSNSILKVVTGKSFSDMLVSALGKATKDDKPEANKDSNKDDKKDKNDSGSSKELKDISKSLSDITSLLNKDNKGSDKNSSGSSKGSNDVSKSISNIASEIKKMSSGGNTSKSDSQKGNKNVYSDVLNYLNKKNTELRLEDAWESIAVPMLERRNQQDIREATR